MSATSPGSGSDRGRLALRWGLRLAGLALPLVAWEVAARRSDNRLTPTASEVWEALDEAITTGDLWFHGRLTLFRGFLGLAIAIVAGVAIGILMARSRWVDAALRPLLDAAYPIPKLALYPVVILLLGFGGASKVWQVALECFFPIAYTTYAGAASIGRDTLWLARNTGAGQWRTTRDVVLPAALPSVLTGIRVATPIMLIVITVTELVGENRGLGFMIRDAQANFRAEMAMAVVLAIGIFGFLLDRLIVLVTRRAVFWERGVTL